MAEGGEMFKIMEEYLRKFNLSKDSVGSYLGDVSRNNGTLPLLKNLLRDVDLPNGSSMFEDIVKVELEAKQQSQKEINDIISGRLVVPVTYTDPDQTPLSGHQASVLKHKWASCMDYLPHHVPLLKFSPWLLDIYLGNYKNLLGQVESLSKAELRRKLAERETLLQVGAIFHVVMGARSLFPGSPNIKLNMKVHSKIELNHMQIFEKLLELGVEVNVHDVAGYTPLHHCLTTYGNPTTFKMAEALLKKGANPNAVNRFGSTPLTECVTANNKDFVTLLMKNGADPYIKDNDGISPYDLGKTFPSMLQLLKKADKKLIKVDRMVSKKVDDFKKCSVCYVPSSLKCSGCSLEWYCSPQCQKKDWPTHKVTCKKRSTEYISVDFLDVASGVVNHMTGKFHAMVPGAQIKDTAPSHCIIKLQTSEMGGEMMIYNKDRSVYGVISSNASPGTVQLYNTVKTKGFQGIKGYFNGLVKDKKLSIHPAIVPPETW